MIHPYAAVGIHTDPRKADHSFDRSEGRGRSSKASPRRYRLGEVLHIAGRDRGRNGSTFIFIYLVRQGIPKLVVPLWDDVVMLAAASSDGSSMRCGQRIEVLFDELAELTGQRNAIDGRIVEIAAEIDRDELWGATGARSVAALMAWKAGISSGNAKTIATVAHRLQDFPRCVQGLREGRFSLDQVGVIAQHASVGSDKH
jgi:hypothetical protein